MNPIELGYSKESNKLENEPTNSVGFLFVRHLTILLERGIVYHKNSLYVSIVRLRVMIDTGKILRLKGKTKKGKSRINEHGALWKVTEIRPFEGVMRLESLKDTFKFNGEWRKDVRWVNVEIVRNDENFELVGIEN